MFLLLKHQEAMGIMRLVYSVGLMFKLTLTSTFKSFRLRGLNSLNLLKAAKKSLNSLQSRLIKFKSTFSRMFPFDLKFLSHS
jgi:hypothetical protein